MHGQAAWSTPARPAGGVRGNRAHSGSGAPQYLEDAGDVDAAHGGGPFAHHHRVGPDAATPVRGAAEVRREPPRPATHPGRLDGAGRSRGTGADDFDLHDPFAPASVVTLSVPSARE